MGRKFGGGLGDGSWCFNERRDITCSVPNQENDEEEDEDEGNEMTLDFASQIREFVIEICLK